MALENLKSVFSDIKKFNRTSLLDVVGDASSKETLTGASGDSINTKPQSVDVFSNEKASGFTTKLNSQSPISLFTGVSEESTNMLWDNNSLYGNTISFEKSNLVDEINFSPGDLDKINKFNTITPTQSPIVNAEDFTPLTENDLISKFSLIDFVPNSLASLTNELSPIFNLDNINVVSPFQKGHFFNFGDNFTEKWSTNLTIGNNEPFGEVGKSEFIEKKLSRGEPIKSIPTQFHSIPLRDVEGGPLGNGVVELNVPDYHINKNNLLLRTGNQITAVNELGKGDLVFETLYNNDGTATINKLNGNLLTNSELPVPHDILDPSSIEPSSIFSPNNRILSDEKRINFFFDSQAGDDFVNRQLGLGSFQKYRSLYDKSSTISMVGKPSEGYLEIFNPVPRNKGLISTGDAIFQFFGQNPTDPTYTEYLDARTQVGSNETYAEYDRRNLPIAYGVSETINQWTETVVDAVSDVVSNAFDSAISSVNSSLISSDASFEGQDDLKIPLEVAGTKRDKKLNSVSNMNNDMNTSKPLGNLGKGDLNTLQPIRKIIGNIDIEKNVGYGLPFYFRDLRDDRVVFFRAYLDGLSETISPNWSSTNYIGRSEPVYTYTNAEREVQFTLKLFAQTKDELNRMYEKINRLTSLCYPEYMEGGAVSTADVDSLVGVSVDVGGLGQKSRMKPPLTKLRIGDWIGSTRKEVTGFIKSLSYSVPDETVWEIETGKKVPKYITADIGFQVIHSTVPSLEFAIKQTSEQNSFYGINQQLFNPTINT